MKSLNLLKIIIFIFIITITSLLYVHQNVEITKMNYLIYEKQNSLYNFYNNRRNLDCDLLALQSPSRLETMLAKLSSESYSFASKTQIVKLKTEQSAVVTAIKPKTSVIRTAGLFRFGSVAEAGD